MITSLPDVRNDFTDVNDAVNAGLSSNRINEDILGGQYSMFSGLLLSEG
jgi:hypothetical protein